MINSRSTTPNEYTSDFSVNLPVAAYSGAKYLQIPGSSIKSIQIHVYAYLMQKISILPKCADHPRGYVSDLRITFAEQFCESEIRNLHKSENFKRSSK